MKLHFMGISGSGMAAVASLASKMGHSVTGCDLKSGGHDEKHLDGIGYLIVSPAVLYQNSTHPEYTKAREKGIVLTWEEFLGEHLLKDKKVIAISGTHGKSTTTAMAGKLLEDCGFDPIVVVGAKVPEWGGNSRFGRGEYAVIEADEFNNNFLHYHPDILIINNIEFDHPDFFENEEQVKESFEKLKNNLKGRKILITEKDSKGVRFNLKIFGEHNQKNANMVYLLGKALGIEESKIINSIENFAGIGRRMELIGTSKSGFVVYDDYAHHPTAIKTTLSGIRSKFLDKKIIVVIEPHGYKRTKALLNLYKGAFEDVDTVIIGPIFKARDQVDPGISSKDLVQISSHKDISFVDSIEKLLVTVKTKASRDDIVVVMGAGESNIWAQRLLEI